MNFRILLTGLIFILSAPVMLAQTLELKGSLQNDQGEVVPLAALSLHQQSDSSMVKTGIADGNGNFRLVGLQAGDYFLQVSSLGHERFATAGFSLTDNLTLPLVQMQKKAQNLEEFTVSAQRPLVETQADRTVFNVEQTATAAGTNGFDLLRKAPGVIIDNSDNVILDGKSGVQLYVDGKPMRLAGSDLTDYLRGLSADEIESIEMITQPSARFEAAGTAGIINLVLKKDLRYGLKGTLETGYAYWDYGKWNNRISLSQRSKKVSFFGSYNNRIFKRRNFINLNREQGGMIYDQRSETVADGNNHQTRMGMDFYANSKSTFGVVVDASRNDVLNTTTTRTPIFVAGETLPSEVLLSGSEDDALKTNVFANANYRFKDTLGHFFSVDFDYGYYESDRINFQPNSYWNGNEEALLFERNFRQVTPVEITILSGKADYEFNLLKHKVTTGVKASEVSTINNFEFYSVEDDGDVFSTDRSNDFSYDEFIGAAYVQMSGSKGKFKYQGGLRAEQTISEGSLVTYSNQGDSLVKRDYLNWFPSGGVSYQLNRINSFGLWYSKRITRPNYQILNPFESNLDELSFQKGNPFLQPQYSHNLKLTHTFKYTLNTSISYTYVEDFFAQVTDTIDGNRNFITTLNVADQEVISLDISKPFTITKWWSAFGSLSLYHNRFIATNDAFQAISRQSLNFYGQNTFSLPREWKFEVSGWFSSPSIWGGTYKTSSQGSLDLGLRKLMMDDKLSVSFAFTDVFFTAPWTGRGEFGGLRINGNGGWESRLVRFNLRYAFGNSAMKNVKLRKGGAETENSRIN